MTDVNSLDDLSNGGKNPETKNTIIKYGVILGLISIIIAVLTNLLGGADPLNPKPAVSFGLGCGGFIISIAVIVVAVKSIRDSEFNAGKISLGDAFKIGFFASIIGTVIAACFNYLNLTVINPEQLEAVREMMEESMAGVDEDSQGFTSFFTNFATNPGMQFVSTLIFGTIFNAIFAIIVAAIVKKD
jgi:hypothetical protein